MVNLIKNIHTLSLLIHLVLNKYLFFAIKFRLIFASTHLYKSPNHLYNVLPSTALFHSLYFFRFFLICLHQFLFALSTQNMISLLYLNQSNSTCSFTVSELNLCFYIFFSNLSRSGI